MPRNAGRRAPDQAPTPCETVDGAWDSSLAGMEYRKSFTLRIINYEKYSLKCYERAKSRSLSTLERLLEDKVSTCVPGETPLQVPHYASPSIRAHLSGNRASKLITHQ